MVLIVAHLTLSLLLLFLLSLLPVVDLLERYQLIVFHDFEAVLVVEMSSQFDQSRDIRKGDGLLKIGQAALWDDVLTVHAEADLAEELGVKDLLQSGHGYHVDEDEQSRCGLADSVLHEPVARLHWIIQALDVVPNVFKNLFIAN